jgi:hypothetical protein
MNELSQKLLLNGLRVRERLQKPAERDAICQMADAKNASTYRAVLDPERQARIDIIIRGLSGEFNFFDCGTLAMTRVLEFSTDLSVDWMGYDPYHAHVYNTIGDGDPFTLLLGSERIAQTGDFLVAFAEGTFIEGDTPPWGQGDFFAATRTQP